MIHRFLCLQLTSRIRIKAPHKAVVAERDPGDIEAHRGRRHGMRRLVNRNPSPIGTSTWPTSASRAAARCFWQGCSGRSRGCPTSSSTNCGIRVGFEPRRRRRRESRSHADAAIPSRLGGPAPCGGSVFARVSGCESVDAGGRFRCRVGAPRLGGGWVVCLVDLGGMSYGVGGAGGDAWTRSGVLAGPASGPVEMLAGLTWHTPVRDLPLGLAGAVRVCERALVSRRYSWRRLTRAHEASFSRRPR
jgi:hypothetical protein